MAYKTIRRDGRNITIDTATGKEVGVGQGALKPLFDTLGLSNLSETLPLTLKQTAADIQNLPRDIGRHLIYSDKVDEKGRPLTIAQADPQKRQLIPEIESYLGRNGKSDQNKPVYGQLPPSVNTNLAAYDESVTLPGVFSDLRGTSATRKPDRTVTSPNTGNMPMSWAQYEVFLASKGIELANTKKQTSGFESVNLPAGSEPITSTKVFQQDGIEFDSLYGGKLRQGDMTTPELKGLGTGMAENYRPGTYGVDPQSGASPLPDASDQSRALEVDQTKNRALPRGARQREKFLAQNPNYGQTSTPKIEKGTGISARGRAFLDAPIGTSYPELMQRTNAAQNILRKDGKIAIKDSEGKYNEISQEGYDKIRGDMRNQTEFSQEFLSQYMTTPAKPADAQSEDAVQPKRATVDLDAMAEAYKPGYFPKELGFNVSYNDEAPDIGLDPKLFSLARFQ